MSSSPTLSLTIPSQADPNSTSKRTNSLAITPLPQPILQLQPILRHHFATYGTINQWVLLPGFNRILVVYEREDDAELAKTACDRIVLEKEQLTIRVYRADPNPLVEPSSDSHSMHYLAPPEPERNFLISPPGSPPVGWEPIKEDPPNATPLADDLMTALENLRIQQTDGHTQGVEMLVDPDEGSGVSVVLEDFDAGSDSDSEDEEWIYGLTKGMNKSFSGRATPIPTAMPPPPAKTFIPTAMPPMFAV